MSLTLKNWKIEPYTPEIWKNTLKFKNIQKPAKRQSDRHNCFL